MKHPHTKHAFLSSVVRVTVPLLALSLLAAASYGHGGPSGARRESRPPKVPEGLQVPEGHELAFRATGVGVQIYVWTVDPANPAMGSWVFKAPHAVLFHQEEHLAGIHFAGPTWQGNDGSKVVGARINSVVVNPQAIPWLLLGAASTSGNGVFADTTYIQRLNTVGGLAPTTPGTVAGEEALVPYIADYLFYRMAE